MTRATDADIIASIAEYIRECHAAARPGAFRIVAERLSDRFGRKIVDRALAQYERALLQERRRLRQENRRLERQVRQARTRGEPS